MTTLTGQQAEAVKTATRWWKREPTLHPFILTGYAGTGKSTILPFIIDDMGLEATSVAFCAPTGKAAKVMGTKLRAFGINVIPTTIHKLIYKPRTEQIDYLQQSISRGETQLKAATRDGLEKIQPYGFDYDKPITLKEFSDAIESLKVILADLMQRNEGPKFSAKGKEEFPKNIKLIVVDEASMVGEDIYNDLASFGVPILAMGDPGQLPPVKASHGFDLHSPNAFLSEIHRQAADNPIIHLATMARQGKLLKVGTYGDDVRVVPRSRDCYTYDMNRDAMVIVGTHKKRWGVTNNIRREMGIEGAGPVKGEPLIVKRNSKNFPELVNGSLLTCNTDIDTLIEGSNKILINAIDTDIEKDYTFWATQGLFEELRYRKRGAYSCQPTEAFWANKHCEHVDFAHAITCHSSQGSQWDEVIVHDESPVFREESDKWLYTAITRAAERLTIVV